MFFKKKPRQYTFVYCPGCNEDLVSQDGAFIEDTDLVRYRCKCGVKSEWNFDFPAPVLVDSWYGNVKVKNENQ